jgi:uncharacterized protein (TIGR03000 family)
MLDKRLLTAAVLAVTAAALTPQLGRAQAANPWECRMLPGGYWQFPNVQWPSDRLYFTGTDDFLNYHVHYPNGGRDSYLVTPADLVWANNPGTSVIEVRLPTNDAAVTVNGVEQKNYGKLRRMATPVLTSGGVYEILVGWYGEDGKPNKETRSIKVQPGDRVFVDFTKPEKK